MIENVSRVLLLLWCSKLYRLLSHALESCSRVKAAVANIHIDVDVCFFLRLTTYQTAQSFCVCRVISVSCTMRACLDEERNCITLFAIGWKFEKNAALGPIEKGPVYVLMSNNAQGQETPVDNKLGRTASSPEHRGQR